MRARQVRAHTTLIVRLLGGGARERDIKERERERARARAREREGENEGERANTRRYRHGHRDAELAYLHHARPGNRCEQSPVKRYKTNIFFLFEPNPSHSSRRMFNIRNFFSQPY